MSQPETEIGNLLLRDGLSLGTVESASGGLISHLITSVPNSSDYFKGSIIAYKNEVKVGVVGVSEAAIQKYGAVSHEVAQEMARGGRKVLKVDVCLADTGIAGPGGATLEKPVGLFYTGLSSKSGTESRKHVFSGDREQNKLAVAQAALAWLKEYLLTLR